MSHKRQLQSIYEDSCAVEQQVCKRPKLSIKRPPHKENLPPSPPSPTSHEPQEQNILVLLDNLAKNKSQSQSHNEEKLKKIHSLLQERYEMAARINSFRALS
eukprot:TRINITY_DN5197_c0_g1_i1.p1 TRINITY_DN5197_c0_g1~~TRINITY_DN5197_c0_g1_i1.p1  ORF type:complete len:102 (+),score=12.70 TRINITY_DN5197_c0_g1_i1:13-318(+)